MTAFFGGMVSGTLFMGAIIIIFFDRQRRLRRAPAAASQFHQPVRVVTRLVINRRTIQL